MAAPSSRTGGGSTACTRAPCPAGRCSAWGWCRRSDLDVRVRGSEGGGLGSAVDGIGGGEADRHFPQVGGEASLVAGDRERPGTDRCLVAHIIGRGPRDDNGDCALNHCRRQGRQRRVRRGPDGSRPAVRSRCRARRPVRAAAYAAQSSWWAAAGKSPGPVPPRRGSRRSPTAGTATG